MFEKLFKIYSEIKLFGNSDDVKTELAHFFVGIHFNPQLRNLYIEQMILLVNLYKSLYRQNLIKPSAELNQNMMEVDKLAEQTIRRIASEIEKELK